VVTPVIKILTSWSHYRRLRQITKSLQTREMIIRLLVNSFRKTSTLLASHNRHSIVHNIFFYSNSGKTTSNFHLKRENYQEWGSNGTFWNKTWNKSLILAEEHDICDFIEPYKKAYTSERVGQWKRHIYIYIYIYKVASLLPAKHQECHFFIILS
jgi:hypothetical protein